MSCLGGGCKLYVAIQSGTVLMNRASNIVFYYLNFFFNFTLLPDLNATAAPKKIPCNLQKNIFFGKYFWMQHMI